jgi:hypothetical protein
MKRGLLAVLGAAILCGACVYVLRGVVGSGVPLTDIVLSTCASALLLALFSAVLSMRAAQRARQAHREMARLARSVEAAIGDLPIRNVLREMTGAAITADALRQEPAAEAGLSLDNVVTLPAARIG